jgi:predicted thioesterase
MHQDVAQGIGIVDIVVSPEMTATLDGTEIHNVYSTFWLAYHAEVAARRAIEPFFEKGDNAVGSGLAIEHVVMAGIGAHVRITATVSEMDRRRIRCTFEAHVLPSATLIARGTQDQVVLPTQVLAERANNAVTT